MLLDFFLMWLLPVSVRPLPSRSSLLAALLFLPIFNVVLRGSCPALSTARSRPLARSGLQTRRRTSPAALQPLHPDDKSPVNIRTGPTLALLAGFRACRTEALARRPCSCPSCVRPIRVFPLHSVPILSGAVVVFLFSPYFYLVSVFRTHHVPHCPPSKPRPPPRAA